MKTVWPSSVEELLALRDEEFLDVAYQLILRRKPDSSGKAYYLDRIRTGGSLHRVVAELALSDEAKAIRAPLTGLFEHLTAYRETDRRHSFMSRLWNPDPFSDGRWERLARRLRLGITRPGGSTKGLAEGGRSASDSPAVEEILKKLTQAVRR